MKERRRFSPAGKWCLLVGVAFGVTALLFGHPFPALVAGFALGLLLFGGGRAPFERLRFLRLPPARLVEDEERWLEIDYSYTGRMAPLAVVLRAPGPAAVLEAATPALLPTPLGRLPIRLRALRRGRHEKLPFEVQLRGAFGLRTQTAAFEVPTDLWVLPRPRALRERVLEQMLALRPWGSERPQPSGPGEGDFFALREWRAGDSERGVSPRLSARRGRKVVRIFRGEAPPVVHLVVDLRVARVGKRFGQVDFDEAMRFAAGIVRVLLRREVPISLTLLENEGARAAVAATCRDLHAYLGALALAKPQPSVAPPDAPIARESALPGRKVLLHLGQIAEEQLPRDWLAIRVGARRYYQLLDHQLGAPPNDAAERADG